jgi:hypothetical protein
MDDEEDFEKMRDRIATEIDKMEETALADAEDIWAQIVSPDDDPKVALYQCCR